MMSAQSSPSIRVDLVDKSSSSTTKKTGKDRTRRVKFGVALQDTLRDSRLPGALVEMLVYIAQEGVTTSDLFRRPGNSSELKVIIARLSEGKEVNLNNYNFYTLASVIKKFLLKIPGGVFGSEVEKKLLKSLDKQQRMEQYDYLHSVISKLPIATQQLLSLLFGTWFRIVNHSEFNAMSSEAVAKSVAGSLFHTCQDDPNKIELAVQVLQVMIDDFGVANMFGRKNIQYFADQTRTGIRVREKFRYEYRYPVSESTGSDSDLELFALKLQQEAATRGFSIQRDAITEAEFYGALSSSGRHTQHTQDKALHPSHPPSPLSLQPSHPPSPLSLHPHHFNPHQKLTQSSSRSAPDVNKVYAAQDLSPAKRMSTSLSRFDNVKKRQMIRMKKRSNWFLSPNTSGSVDTESMLGSREASTGRSSLGAASSDDGLLSDMTVSDGAVSDTHIDTTFECTNSSTPKAYRQVAVVQQDIVNGNHDNHDLSTGGATCQSSLVPPWDSSSPSRSPSPQVPVTSSKKMSSYATPARISPPDMTSDGQVRYFMLETFYGSAGHQDDATPAHR